MTMTIYKYKVKVQQNKFYYFLQSFINVSHYITFHECYTINNNQVINIFNETNNGYDYTKHSFHMIIKNFKFNLSFLIGYKYFPSFNFVS